MITTAAELGRTEPTEDQVLTILRTHGIECTGLGEVTCVGCRSAGWMTWGEYRLHLARAVLALLPQRVAPSVDAIFQMLEAHQDAGSDRCACGYRAMDISGHRARWLSTLYASQPTVAEVKATEKKRVLEAIQKLPTTRTKAWDKGWDSVSLADVIAVIFTDRQEADHG